MLAAFDALAERLGYGSNRSALLADLACAAVGRHDLTLRADFDVRPLLLRVTDLAHGGVTVVEVGSGVI